MQTLKTAVDTALGNIIESGIIEKSIEEQITKTIGSILADQLRSYSDFGKKLDEAVSNALQVDFSNLGLPGYNNLVLKVVRRQVEAVANKAITEQLETQMARLLAPPPAEIELTALVAQFIEQNRDSHSRDRRHSRISLHVEQSEYGSRWIAMDRAPGKAKYECGIRFGVQDEGGKIFALNIEGRDAESRLFVGNLYNFERSLFQMYAAGTKLIVDEADADDIDTDYGDCDD